LDKALCPSVKLKQCVGRVQQYLRGLEVTVHRSFDNYSFMQCVCADAKQRGVPLNEMVSDGDIEKGKVARFPSAIRDNNEQ
jgi:hypothetical protein